MASSSVDWYGIVATFRVVASGAGKKLPQWSNMRGKWALVVEKHGCQSPRLIAIRRTAFLNHIGVW